MLPNIFIPYRWDIVLVLSVCLASIHTNFYPAMSKATTPTFPDGFQYNLPELFSIISRSAVSNICSEKVQGQGHTSRSAFKIGLN